LKLIVEKTEKIKGETLIPSSKSHTIRAVIFASLAEGKSIVGNPLKSGDTQAAINACSALGAEIRKKSINELEILGFNGNPIVKKNKINTVNSGTTTNLITSVAALTDKKIIIDGDESIRKRPVEPLLSALNNLGAKAFSINNNGCPPIEIHGKLIGGQTSLDCKSSQYLSSLLITCPLLEQDTNIEIQNLCEAPYIEMTLKWLDDLDIKYRNNNLEKITVYRNQRYRSFNKTIPSDWSSATFILVAAAMLGENVIIKGLDVTDTQADKEVLTYLKEMGAAIKITEKGIIVNKSRLTGCDLNLDNTPDALPAIAVLGCYAEDTTTIKNVVHARIKETDRIKVMTQELSKMGAKIQENYDGMTIEKSRLQGTKVKGYQDHRVIMALSLAGMIAEGKTEIDTAEAFKVTFPNYMELMKSLGAKMTGKVK
jgi:3-phosphoshikimate 1-carboxyvinyltransferase